MSARPDAEGWRAWLRGASPPAPDAQEEAEPVRPGDADAGAHGDGPARVVSAEELNAWLRDGRSSPAPVWRVPAPEREES